MNLQRKIQLGGMAILAALTLALLVAAVGIQQIRFGGPQHRADQTMSELEADVLPPPLFVVEPWLEVTLAADNPAQADEHLATLAEQRKAYEARKTYWRDLVVDESIRHGIDSTTATGDAFWQAIDNEFVPAVRSGDVARGRAAHERLAELFRVHRKAVDALVTQVGHGKAETAATAARVLAFTLVLLGVLAGGIIALVLYSRKHLLEVVVRPLAASADATSRMASGDLDIAAAIDPTRSDEIGALNRALGVFRQAAVDRRSAEEAQREVVTALSAALDRLAEGDLSHTIDRPFTPEYETVRLGYNATIAQLATLMQRVSASATSVATGSGEIRAASDDLALRNEQQAASLEETAAAMKQVTAIVRETAESAGKVQTGVGQAHREATDGGETVRRAIGAMTAIEQGAREINQIINVIDGIAFQTNLLALNAGVEAARAGDAGKGFSVVANEVRALAQRSADAARDIKALISGSTEQVEDGVRLVNETGAMFDKIMSSVGEINLAMAEIARATENQSANLDQVSAAIGEMDRMTQQNAAMVEQSTAAARSLADEARSLADQVGAFETGGTAPGTTVTPFARSPQRPSVSPARPPVRPLATHGNLALKAAPSGVADDDWTEF